jgi:hypothetical protein
MGKLFNHFLGHEFGAIVTGHGSISAGIAAKLGRNVMLGKRRRGRDQLERRLGRLVGSQGVNGSGEQAAAGPTAAVSNRVPDRGDA